MSAKITDSRSAKPVGAKSAPSPVLAVAAERIAERRKIFDEMMETVYQVLERSVGGWPEAIEAARRIELREEESYSKELAEGDPEERREATEYRDLHALNAEEIERCAEIYAEHMRPVEEMAAHAREAAARHMEMERLQGTGIPKALRSQSPQTFLFELDFN